MCSIPNSLRPNQDPGSQPEPGAPSVRAGSVGYVWRLRCSLSGTRGTQCVRTGLTCGAPPALGAEVRYLNPRHPPSRKRLVNCLTFGERRVHGCIRNSDRGRRIRNGEMRDTIRPSLAYRPVSLNLAIQRGILMIVKSARCSILDRLAIPDCRLDVF